MPGQLTKRLVVIGIGGASCSGKTLLAKHIRRALPQGSHIIHQDDFCPPEDKVLYSDRYPDLQDWDDPETCIMWPEFRSILNQVRKTGQHGAHASHDHLNKQVEVGIQEDIFTEWKDRLRRYIDEQESKGVELVWYIVDGFVLYWDKEIVDNLDVRIFLRVPYSVLKARREERQVYVLQHGGVWVDPPGYFDKIVWPGYVKAHREVFEEVERGDLKKGWGPEGRNLSLVQPGEGEEGMTMAFDKACEAILKQCEEGAGTVISA
ncbi:nicotinamide riboside kinase [Kwoniella mangroviensis CBS 10435]|uniref:Nicotinamide riboside kinase n=1 Tax=Kwoniella mangroviensis CBS 10435 TaxID=1331196 RepID=A0A1B9J0X9_9TREE|nr:nicotinamide riboside kinase [Kwoniella mangroviensis CBS 10435]